MAKEKTRATEFLESIGIPQDKDGVMAFNSASPAVKEEAAELSVGEYLDLILNQIYTMLPDLIARVEKLEKFVESFPEEKEALKSTEDILKEILETVKKSGQ